MKGEDTINDTNEQHRLDTLLTSLLNSVRCAAHSFQLPVHDVIQRYAEELR